MRSSWCEGEELDETRRGDSWGVNRDRMLTDSFSELFCRKKNTKSSERADLLYYFLELQGRAQTLYRAERDGERSVGIGIT